MVPAFLFWGGCSSVPAPGLLALLQLLKFWARTSWTCTLYHDFQMTTGIFFWQFSLGRRACTPKAGQSFPGHTSTVSSSMLGL